MTKDLITRLNEGPVLFAEGNFTKLPNQLDMDR